MRFACCLSARNNRDSLTSLLANLMLGYMENSSQEPLRSFLLKEARRFVCDASQMQGIVRIAMIGSLLTIKLKPKDADLLVTVSSVVNIGSLAKRGRRLKGRAQSKSSGADIFLCNEKGEYLGRACGGTQCDMGTHICNDFESVLLDTTLTTEPPLELWSEVVRRANIPKDVEDILLKGDKIDGTFQTP